MWHGVEPESGRFRRNSTRGLRGPYAHGIEVLYPRSVEGSQSMPNPAQSRLPKSETPEVYPAAGRLLVGLGKLVYRSLWQLGNFWPVKP